MFSRARSSGFTLLELVIVIILIGLLYYIGLKFFNERIDNSRSTAVRYQANAFARTVENMRAARVALGNNPIYLDGISVYFNEHGWPSSTMPERNPAADTQTQRECLSLWQNMLSKAQNVQKEGKNRKKTGENFKVVLKNKYICRYILSRTQDESLFFDYDVRTGAVTWQDES
jgi:MSHA pilin protein MshB